MKDHNQNETFLYSYSAKQQEEIEQIRQKYLPKEEDKMAYLRRLDAGADRKGNICSLICGIISCLLFGFGMSCVLALPAQWFIPGCVCGAFGIVGMILAYPLYVKITKRERERVAPEILRLTEELLQ